MTTQVCVEGEQIWTEETNEVEQGSLFSAYFQLSRLGMSLKVKYVWYMKYCIYETLDWKYP